MAFDTFDTDSVATAGVTFTNGNLTAQGASGASLNASSIAQSVEGKKSGKWYVEFTCVAVSGNVDGVGVTSSWGIGGNTGGTGGFLGGTNTNLPSGDNGWDYFTNGNIATKNAVQTAVNHPTWTTGDVIGLAIDLDNSRLWWRKNTGSYAGTSGTPNPATNTSGFDISHLLSNNCRVFPAVNLSGGSAKFTANFGASAFTGSVPSGFNSGWTNTQGTTVFGSFCNPGLGATASGNFPASSNKAVSKYTSSFTGSVSKITVAYTATTLTDLKGVIYDATGTGGLPGALLGVSSNTISSSAYGENDFTFSGVNLVSTTAYWFGTVTDSSNNLLLFVASGSALTATNSGTYASPTNPFGASPTTTNNRAPILITANLAVNLSLVAATASGASAAFIEEDDISLAGAAASGVVEPFSITASTNLSLSSVTAAGTAEPFTLNNVIALNAVFTSGRAVPIIADRNIVTVPLITILNDLPIPVSSAMNNAPVPNAAFLPSQLPLAVIENSKPVAMSGQMTNANIPMEGSFP